MKPALYDKAYRLFADVCDLDPTQRAAMLNTACAGDRELQREVELLLEKDAGGSAMLHPDTLGEHSRQQLRDRLAAVDRPGADVQLPEKIGRYRILSRIADGGMGTVYEAEQDSPRRRVALKVVRTGLATAATLRRLEFEAQVLGMLQHPGIARIYEAGSAQTPLGEQPFFAMELVTGRPIVQYANAMRLGVRERLELLTLVGEAVEHAHQKGVVHRDLKPSNVLVTESGEPKVLDFGVARAIDHDCKTTTLRTSVNELVGTLPYMSPEQAAGDPAEIDTRSDVYSLGVIAYELLTGQPPYDLKDRMIHDALRVIREEEPTRLSVVDRALRGDVETIVATALAKDKRRRYQSAGAMAADIRRHLADHPIVARPPTATYQLSKFARRHRTLLGGVAAAFVLLITGVTTTTVAMFKARSERQDAELVVAMISEILESARPEVFGRDVKVLEILAPAVASIDQRAAGRPLVAARLRRTLGATYLSLGDFDAALPLLEESLAVHHRQLGESHPQSLETAQVYGELLFKRRDYEQAEPLLERTLALHRQVHGDQHPDTLVAAEVLAELYRARSRFDDAEPLYRQVLQTRRSTLGADHLDTLGAMEGLALVHRGRGEFSEALPLLLDVLTGRRNALGEEHRSVQEARANLGWVYYDMGQYPEARGCFGSALAIQRRVLGEDHPETLSSMHNLGAVHLREGELELADPLLARAFTRRQAVEGNDSLSTLSSQHLLGVLRRMQGRVDEARSLMEDALVILHRRYPGERHTLDTMASLISLYRQEGELDQAEAMALELLEVRRRVHGGDEHHKVLVVKSHLGRIHLARGDFEQALHWTAQCAEAAPRLLPGGNWKIGFYREGLGLSLAGLERYEEAERELLAAYRILREGRGVENRYTRHAADALVELYAAWGRPGQSESDELSLGIDER